MVQWLTSNVMEMLAQRHMYMYVPHLVIVDSVPLTRPQRVVSPRSASGAATDGVLQVASVHGHEEHDWEAGKHAGVLQEEDGGVAHTLVVLQLTSTVHLRHLIQNRASDTQTWHLIHKLGIWYTNMASDTHTHNIKYRHRVSLQST